MNKTITKDHIKLLVAMNVSWNNCETGAPTIDPKRPYGNSNVITDIAEFLEIKGFEDHNGETHFSKEQWERMAEMHKEMEHVLQHLLTHLADYVEIEDLLGIPIDGY